MATLERLSNGIYRLPLSAQPPDELMTVPGLRWNPAAKLLSGYADAMAVACKHLRLPPPAKPEPIASHLLSNSPLFPFQREDVAQLAALQREEGGGALLANEMGLGKTLEAIYLAKLQGAKRVLVACPARARYTWLEELKKWGDADSVALMLPKGTKRSAQHRELAASARWVISSYNLLPEVPGNPPSMLILDECHEVKNRNAGRTRAAADMSVQVPWRLGISATPAWNRPKDWWQVLRVVLGGHRFGSKHLFEAAYCDGHQGRFGWEAKGISRAEELRERLGLYMVRREKKDVASQLPPKTRQAVWIDATPEATTALRAWGARAISLTRAQDVTLEAKMPVAVELAHSAGRFLLFTYHPAHARKMAFDLQAMGTQCVVLTGEETEDRRRANVDLARANGWGVVATIGAAGTSLNLQGMAEVGIMHSLDYVPFKLAQAEDRLHRWGIDKPVNWYYTLMRNSADMVVWQSVKDKIAQATSTMAQTAVGGMLELSEDAKAQSMADVYALFDAYNEQEEEDWL